MSKNTVQRIVCDRLIAELDRGNIPWRKPWSAPLAPQNYVSKRRYQGINFVLLSFEVARQGCPYFASLKQVRNLGGRVLDSEFKNSSIVVFWKWIEVQDDEGKIQSVPFLRYSRVYNLQQCQGLDWTLPIGHPADPIVECEKILAGFQDGPAIVHDGGDRCCYSPLTDTVHLPIRELFESSLYYWSSTFHEISHSTAHPKRLNRPLSTDRNSITYATEELIAEASSAMLMGAAGINELPIIENSAAYIRGWKRFLQDHPNCVTSAFSKAQKAADFILGKRRSQGSQMEEYHVAA